jgi:glucokinase
MDVLVGDVGGTKCLFSVRRTDCAFAEERRYDSRAYPRFADVVRAFLDDTGARPDAACFAIAGPILGDMCRTTNLPWVIDARELERELAIPRVRLVNDFHAQALAVLVLGERDYEVLVPGVADPKGPIAVLGAGTGLGEAFLVHDGANHRVVASEGGHADFAPTDELEDGLLRWLRRRHHRVSYERVLSGMGLTNIYGYLRELRGGEDAVAMRPGVATEDPNAAITRLGLAGADPVCAETLDVFCRIYGQLAGNLALSVLATGGVWLCGGIAPRLLPRLRSGGFLTAYTDKGRLSPLVAAMPVRVVTNTSSGLVGAAAAVDRA